MTAKEWELVMEILSAMGKLPEPKQHQLLGVAQGMTLAADATATAQASAT